MGKVDRRSRTAGATKPHMLALEPRMLLDGAGLVTGADAADEAAQAEAADAVIRESGKPTDLDQRAAKIAKALAEHDATRREAAVAGDESNRGNEVAVVDESVQHHETLADAAESAGMDVVEISGDGVAEMADALAGRDTLAAVHVLSHGAQGEITLGNDTLRTSTLESHEGALNRVSESLAPGADLMLYGCRVAQGSTGQGFVADVARATGADVKASSDLTGNAGRGGDWSLEYTANTTGEDATAASRGHGDPDVPSIAARAPSIRAYQGVLTPSPGTIGWGTGGEVQDFPGNGGTGSDNPAATDANGSGLDVLAEGTDLRLDWDHRSPLSSDGDDRLLEVTDDDSNISGDLQYVSFTSNGGGEFQLDQFDFGYNGGGDKDFDVKAYHNGSQVGSNVTISSISNDSGGSVSVGGDFEYIDEFRVTEVD